MAVLNSDQLTDIRRTCASELPTTTHTKAQINAATQAVEDWFESNRPALNNVINTATAPLVLGAPAKLTLIKQWLRQKSERGG